MVCDRVCKLDVPTLNVNAAASELLHLGVQGSMSSQRFHQMVIDSR